MAPHYCLYPPDPDVVLGIGVRSTLYVQALSIVVASYFTKPRVVNPPLPNGWRVQSFTLLVFFGVELYQRLRGQLSYFNEVAVVHLVLLGYDSVWFARTLQRNRFTWAHIRDIFKNIQIRKIPYNFGSLVIQGRLTAQTVVFFIALILLWLDSACQTYPSNAAAASSAHVVWVTLFGFRFIPAVGLILPSITSWTILLAFYIQYRRSSNPDSMLGRARNVLFAVFLWYWVEEVVAIERSMQENAGLDRKTENAWGTGQIIPFGMLLPFLYELKIWRREETRRRIEDIEMRDQ